MPTRPHMNAFHALVLGVGAEWLDLCLWPGFWFVSSGNRWQRSRVLLEVPKSRWVGALPLPISMKVMALTLIITYGS